MSTQSPQSQVPHRAQRHFTSLSATAGAVVVVATGHGPKPTTHAANLHDDHVRTDSEPTVAFCTIDNKTIVILRSAIIAMFRSTVESRTVERKASMVYCRVNTVSAG